MRSGSLALLSFGRPCVLSKNFGDFTLFRPLLVRRQVWIEEIPSPRRCGPLGRDEDPSLLLTLNPDRLF